MPVLRQAPDNTLSEVLGNLGSSLAQNLNPLNAIRSQDMMAQIQQRQWEVQHAQTLDAANRNAADVYVRANPFNQDDASLAVSAAKIRNGQGDLEGAINAAKALKTWQGAQAAAAMIDADPEMATWDAADRASVKARMLSDPNMSLTVAKQQHAQQKMEEAKTGAAIGAGDAAAAAASMPGADPEAAALARSQALTDPSAAEKNIIAPQRARIGATSMPADTSQFSPVVTQETQRQLEAGQTPTLPAQIQPQKIASDVATDTAKKMFGWHDPNQVFSGGVYSPSDLTVTPAPPATPGAPPAAAPPAPAGSVSVAPAPPDTAAAAASTAAQTSSKAATDFASAQLQDGIGDGVAGKKVLNDIKQLRRLGDLMDNDGLMTSAQNEIASRLYSELGLTLTPGQTAREVFDTYKAALMANWRKDEGIQRLALPEIQLGNISLPSARMSHDALNQALDAFQAKAALGVKVGEAATKYWGEGPTPANAAKFFAERDKIYDPANNPTDKIRDERQAKPPPVPPAVPPGTVRMGPTGLEVMGADGRWGPKGR